ncbi:MAG: ATP-binding protein [Methanophagales archaeon]|nr:ATP-binding protein [Methanophagales archaeon]
MKNPFRYGEVVTGEDFADRETELENIIRDLKAGQTIFLISPRRYGKTSLIINALKRLQKDGFLTAYIDLFKVSSFKSLLELYTGIVSRAAETKIERFNRLVRDFFPNIRPKVVITPDGSPSIEIDYEVKERSASKLFDEVYEAPQRIAKKRNKNFIVVFDEFQEIANLNGEVIEKGMRACFQHHDHVSYLFAGSRRHIISDMVSNKRRAFYNMGKVMPLGKIPVEEFKSFLEDKFSRTGFSLENGVLDEILDVTENYPYNVQFLCHELWNNCLDSRRVAYEDITPTMNRILDGQSAVYVTIWNTLPLHQKRILIAIASSGGENIFSRDFIRDNDLGAASSVQTSINLLMKKEIIEKEGNIYYISDVFFKIWIRKEMM